MKILIKKDIGKIYVIKLFYLYKITRIEGIFACKTIFFYQVRVKFIFSYILNLGNKLITIFLKNLSYLI